MSLTIALHPHQREDGQQHPMQHCPEVKGTMQHHPQGRGGKQHHHHPKKEASKYHQRRREEETTTTQNKVVETSSTTPTERRKTQHHPHFFGNKEGSTKEHSPENDVDRPHRCGSIGFDLALFCWLLLHFIIKLVT